MRSSIPVEVVIPKLLAETIQQTLGAESTLYPDLNKDALQADRLFVGFWTDKGSCDVELAKFLSGIRDKNVFLFGTAGFGGDPAYFEKILTAVKQNLDPSVRVIGSFMCQGKMQSVVRERYVAMHMDAMVENFDRALNHPDEHDLDSLKSAVRSLGC